MRLGVHEAYGWISPKATMPCSGVRHVYELRDDYGVDHAHVRELQAKGLWVLPMLQPHGTPQEWAAALTRLLDHPVCPRFEIIELGNEPEWGRTDDPEPAWADYLAKLRLGAPIARAHGIKVLAAAAMDDTTARYLNFLVEHEAWPLADAASLHPYARTPEDVVANVEKWRGMIPKTKSLYVTEFGWSTGFGQHDTEDQQADYLVRTVRGLRSQAKTLDLRYLGWFCWHDARRSDYWAHTGLVRVDGHRKKAFYRLKGLA